jgi:hypothetical protein
MHACMQISIKLQCPDLARSLTCYSFQDVLGVNVDYTTTCPPVVSPSGPLGAHSCVGPNSCDGPNSCVERPLRNRCAGHGAERTLGLRVLQRSDLVYDIVDRRADGGDLLVPLR